MAAKGRNLVRAALVMTIVLLLALPIQVIGAADEEEMHEEGEQTVEIPEGVLSEEQVRDLGIPVDDMPGRSPPWGEWERIGYHRGRYDGAMAYNGSSNRLYLYGGGYEYRSRYGVITHHASSDFFYYDLGTGKWTNIYLEGFVTPEGRYRMSYAVDEARGKMYIYGGFKDDRSISSMEDDLWEFDFHTETWTRLAQNVLSSTPGGKRARAPMVLDPDSQILYIHMGEGTTRDNVTGFYYIDLKQTPITARPVMDLGETFMVDGTESGMLPRYLHDMCIDEVSGRIYLWGGEHRYNASVTGYLKEFWMFDILSRVWTQLSVMPDITHQSREGWEYGGAKIFYNSNGTVNIWGGRQNNTSRLETDLLWVYQSGAWTMVQFASAPSARFFYPRHYSETENRFYVFAGTYAYYSRGVRISSTGYRDIGYLDAGSLSWTTFPLNITSATNGNGIFAHNKGQQRLYYIGPNRDDRDDSIYIYYFDLRSRDWNGPLANTGDPFDRSRSAAGIAYVPEDNDVYFYGGGWTRRQGYNTYYYETNEIWRIDLDTMERENIKSLPYLRQGIEMIYHPQDRSLYFFGGCNHPSESSSSVDAFGDFYRYDIPSRILYEVYTTFTPPARYAYSFALDTDDDDLYMFGGVKSDGNYDNNLYKYDFQAGDWTHIQILTRPSARDYGKMVYDSLTRELYLLGGSGLPLENFDKYRLDEGKWEFPTPIVTPNPGAFGGHAMIFDEEARDLWVFGEGSSESVWRLGILPRLGLKNVRFLNPTKGSNVAFAMYDTPYTFSASVRTVNDRKDDLSEMVFDFATKGGSYRVLFNSTAHDLGLDAWSEKDPNDYAELTNADVNWATDESMVTVTFALMFHWNWITPTQDVQRILKVTARGNEIMSDTLTKIDFLKVRNKVDGSGELMVEADGMGAITNDTWVKGNATLTFTGPVIIYQGYDDIYPSADEVTVSLWDKRGRRWNTSYEKGEQVEFIITAPAFTGEEEYHINVTGIPPESDETVIEFGLRCDATPPQPPDALIIHADDYGDMKTTIDDDMDVFVTWQASSETQSGIKTYYYSFEDEGGTRVENRVNRTLLPITVPSNGTHTLYVWAEDEVGNIGMASNASVLIDDVEPAFEMLNPDLTRIIPYNEIEIRMRISDMGGTHLHLGAIQYRFTTRGQSDQKNWLGDNAWKYHIPDISMLLELDEYEFSMILPGLTEGPDNWIQFNAIDKAGNIAESIEYKIYVDSTLRYPKVELLSPDNKAEFQSPDGIVLSWEVDFFLPEDVTYKLYLHNDKDLVRTLALEAHQSDIKGQTQYEPNWLTYGWYYWTIVPWAQNRYEGNCTNGVFSFFINNEENYRIEAMVEPELLKIPRGGENNAMFTVTNRGKETAIVVPGVESDSLFNISFVFPGGEDVLRIDIEGSKSIRAFIKVNESAPLGNYTLSFNFNTTRGIKVVVNLSVQVTPSRDDVTNGEDEGSDLSFIIPLIIVLVLILMVTIGAVYYFVFKRKAEKRTTPSLYDDMEELDRDISNRSAPEPIGLRTAPEPKGLRGAIGGKAKRGEIASGVVEGELPPATAIPEGEAELEPLLVEPGSEDDWMNLVAKETMAAEAGQFDRVPGEGAEEAEPEEEADHKSLSDILSEMENEAGI